MWHNWPFTGKLRPYIVHFKLYAFTESYHKETSYLQWDWCVTQLVFRCILSGVRHRLMTQLHGHSWNKYFFNRLDVVLRELWMSGRSGCRHYTILIDRTNPDINLSQTVYKRDFDLSYQESSCCRATIDQWISLSVVTSNHQPALNGKSCPYKSLLTVRSLINMYIVFARQQRGHHCNSCQEA